MTFYEHNNNYEDSPEFLQAENEILYQKVEKLESEILNLKGSILGLENLNKLLTQSLEEYRAEINRLGNPNFQSLQDLILNSSLEDLNFPD